MNRKKWIALPTAALLLFSGIVPVSAADAELQSLQTALLGLRNSRRWMMSTAMAL